MRFYLLLAFLFVFVVHSFSQSASDSIQSPNWMDSLHSKDSILRPVVDSPMHLIFTPSKFIGEENIVRQNKLFDLSLPSVSLITNEKQQHGKEFLFYALAILVLLTGMFKAFYSRYFNTIFRVYFNTSLRQNQLTDLLIQAKLPSLIFNILFFITGGIYSWLILSYYHWTKEGLGFMFIPIAFLALAFIYIGKYCVIKFLGWISGTSEAADSYIFIVFLINKIIGILLIPFIILLAFSPKSWQGSIILMSLSMLGLLFLSRYLRSYDLIKQKLVIGRLHFLLYIIAIEILPILIITKTMINMLI